MNTRRTSSKKDGESTPSRRAQEPSSTRRSHVSKGDKPGSNDATGSERVRGVRKSPRTRKKVEESSKGKGRGVSEEKVSDSETEEGDAVGESVRNDVSEVDSVRKSTSVGEEEEREDPVAPASETVVRRGDKEERQRKVLDKKSKPRVKKEERRGRKVKPRPPDRVPLVTSPPGPRNFVFSHKGEPPIKYETGNFARQFSLSPTDQGETRKMELGESCGSGGVLFSISNGRVIKSASEKLALRNLSEAMNSSGKGKLSKKEARLLASVDGIFERFLKNVPKPRRRCDRCRDEGLPPEVCDFRFPCARCKLAGVKCTLNNVSPFSTRQELEQFQAHNGRKTVMLVGGMSEGDWDDFDFTLEAIPIGGRRDPGPGVYVPSEEEIAVGRDTSLQWCRWVVSSVGFFPPRGRPGIAQLAGIEPGHELTGVWVCPDVRVEAGCMGRAWITKELCRLSEWGRSRGRGMPQRESFISDEHMEWEFPWKLEFCRCEEAFTEAGIGNTGGYEQEEVVESSVPSSVSPQGTKRERPLSNNAFLRFRIFCESGYEKDGGRVFTVRVTEEGEDPETNDLIDVSSSDASILPHVKTTFEVIRLLGLPPEVNDMVQQRVGLRDDYDKERFFGGVGRGSVGGHMQLDGEEKVVLPMILDGPEGSNGHRHLLTGLAPPAVRLVKERIFAMARLQYAFLYGLCPSASSVEVVSEPASEPAPSVRIDCGVASNGGSSVSRRASEGRGFVKSEGMCRVSLEGVGDEQLGPGKPGSVDAGMGGKQGGGEGSVFVEDGDVGIGSQEEGVDEVRACGQVSRGLNVGGGKGKGREGSRTHREGGEKERDIAIAVSNRPGSGALTAKLREAIRSEGFLSWVRELRRRSRTLATGRDGGWAYGDGERKGEGKGKGKDVPEEEEGLMVQEGVGMWATVDGVTAPCRNPLRFAVGLMPVVCLDLEAATEGKLTVVNDDRMYPAVFESVAEAVANKALFVKEVNIDTFFTSAAATATSKRDYQNAKRLQKTLRLTVEEAGTRFLFRHIRSEMEKACNSAILKKENWILTESSFAATVCRSLNELSFDPATAATGISRHTKRAFPKIMFSSQPTWAEAASAAVNVGAICVLCMLPLAFKCECSYGLLALRRKYWAERTLLVHREDSDVAVDIGIPSLFPSTRPGYRGDVSHHRWLKGQYTCRYDQSISLHHRGLQRFPLHSKITSWKPSDLEALRPMKRSREPPDEGAAAAEDISPSLPRLEKWPGFPSPATAFAPAAPSENPKGMMPPSPRLLRYIHQMASMKVHGMSHEIYGSLDASALIAVGVIVEEMLEELVSPLVDGRTKGYKHLTPESLARELAFSNRTKNGIGLDQAPVPPPPLQSGVPVAPLSKKRRFASTEISKLEEEEAVPAVDSPELRALCRVYGARAPDVVCAWKKIEQDRQV